MKIPATISLLLTCAGIILLTFVIVSLLDVVLAVLYSRFYSNASFIVTFGVGGIFAGVIGYMSCIEKTSGNKTTIRVVLISFLIISGLLFFFPLATLEGGEYEYAFKAFGLTLAATSLLFVKGKPD